MGERAAETDGLRDALNAVVPFPEGRFAGRGIVICAGGPRYFTCAFVLLWYLRERLNCNLPVQLWHLGAKEMSPAMRSILTRQGAELVDAEPLLARHPARLRNGWALKPYAVMHARFAEVISIDADALPLINPVQLFSWPDYLAHGAQFWPDIVDLALENPIWAVLGLMARREIAFETGLFVVDKRRVWDALCVTVALNSRSDELYRMIHGEKDSFLLAFRALGKAFGLAPHRPMVFDSDLLQRDEDGAPLLYHRTAWKYLYEGPNRPGFTPEITADIEMALTELRRLWTGTIFFPPVSSPRALEVAEALAGLRFLFQSSEHGERLMVLDANGQVGIGRGDYEQHWAVVEQNKDCVLQFFSGTRLILELREQSDHAWTGTAILHPPFAVRMVAEDAAATFPRPQPMKGRILVAALLDAVGYGAGAHEESFNQLAAALELLNKTNDDVPDAVDAWLASARFSDTKLAALSARLAVARDERRAAAERGPVNTQLNPGFYDRVP